jgi:hypothetical protein
VYGTFRYTSGTPYSRCNPGPTDRDVISGDNCDREFPEGLNGSRIPAFKEFNLRFTKGFALGGLDLTAYLDARNVLNFKNIIQVFAATNDVRNNEELQAELTDDRQEYQDEAKKSGVAVSQDGTIDLSFGGTPDPRTGCSNWVTQDGVPAAPNCVALIRTEERYGNGDHLFTADEQDRAGSALYYTIRGLQNFTSTPRRLRAGVEVNF